MLGAAGHNKQPSRRLRPYAPPQGPFDAAFFNAVFGNLHDQHEALLRAALLLRPGAYVAISHPLGRPWLERFRCGGATS